MMLEFLVRKSEKDINERRKETASFDTSDY